MEKVCVIVGPFRRPIFRSGLLKQIGQNTEFEVYEGTGRDVADQLKSGSGAVVFIADARIPQSELQQTQPNDALTIVWVEDEGKDVTISTKNVHAHRLTALVRAATQRPLSRIAAAFWRLGTPTTHPRTPQGCKT